MKELELDMRLENACWVAHVTYDRVVYDKYTKEERPVGKGDLVLLYSDPNAWDFAKACIPYDVVPHIMRELGL